MAAPHRPRPRKSPKSPAGAQSSRRRAWHTGRHAGRGRSSEAGDVAHGGPNSSTIAALRGASSLLSLLSHVSLAVGPKRISPPGHEALVPRLCENISEERDESGRDGGLVGPRELSYGFVSSENSTQRGAVHVLRRPPRRGMGRVSAASSTRVPRPDATFATNRNVPPAGASRGAAGPQPGSSLPNPISDWSSESRIRHTGQSAGSGSGGSKCAHQNSSPPSFLQPRRMVSASSHPLSSLRHGW